MKSFHLSKLQADHQAAGRLYLEFLRQPSMSAGLYILPAGAVDPQLPHREDELYYVIRGTGRFEANGEQQAVEAGSILFVPAEAPHRFYEIREDLAMLVLFAPAESGSD